MRSFLHCASRSRCITTAGWRRPPAAATLLTCPAVAHQCRHSSSSGSAAPPAAAAAAEELAALNRELRLILKAAATSLPLSKLASRITDDGQDVLEKLPGGLMQYIKSHPEVFKLARDPTSSLNVVSLVPTPTPSSSSGGEPIAVSPALLDEIARVIEAQPFSQALGVSVARVYSNLSASSRLLLKPHKSLIHLLQQFKDRFELIGGNSQVKLLRTGPKLTATAAIDSVVREAKTELPSAASMDSTGVAALCFTLRELVPFDYFIPVSQLLERGSPILRILGAKGRPMPNAAAALEALLQGLRRTPDGFAEVRVFDESNADSIFLRLVNVPLPAPPVEETDAPPPQERGDALHQQRFGGLVDLSFKLFTACEAHGAEEFLVSDMEELFDADLLAQLPLTGYPAILLFERMSHFFEVHTSTYTVRLRGGGALADNGRAVEYSAAATPLLRAVREVAVTVRRPMTIGELNHVLPADMLREINLVFGSLVGFVEAHPMCLLMSGDLVYATDHTTSGGKGFRKMHLTDEQLARAAYEMLPPSEPVLFGQFVRYVASEYPQMKQHTKDFFLSFPALFSLYLGLFNSEPLLTRRGAPTPPYVHPPCRTLHDALREIAIASAGGAEEGTINNHMTPDARSMMKAFGGLDCVVRQLPQWFDVTNERNLMGNSFISYVGHLPKK